MPLVHLNVGGSRYSTSTTTMNRDANSMLAVMLLQENEKTLINNGQEIFIDRNGKMFEYILDYLRNGLEKTILPDDGHFLERLLNEADFYQLNELVQFIKQKLTEMKNRQPLFDIGCFVKFTPHATTSVVLQEYLDMMNNPNYVDVKFGPDMQDRLQKVPCWYCGEPVAQKIVSTTGSYSSSSLGTVHSKQHAFLLSMWGQVCSTTDTCCLVKFVYPNFKSAVVLRENSNGQIFFDRVPSNHILMHIPILLLEKL